MKTIIAFVALILISPVLSSAQECGPSCPVCSGISEGALIGSNAIMVSVLSVPTSDEERAVFNGRYGIFSWLDVGAGYAARTEKFLWNVRVEPLAEDEGGWRPGIILGSGSVQIGGSDQSVYAQLTKSLEFGESFALRLSAGSAALVPDFDEVYGLAGVTASIYERFSLFTNYDGRAFHEGASIIPLEWLTLSFLLVETEYPAISVAFKM
jgi:hypothetical protein